ncbi:matrixin family metalloprotease [candidate division KSB1 bacterium]|nr:matrixin family metalloprotease [candidate division KSB1 bacterium]
MNTWNQVRSSYFRFADGGLTSQKTISGSDGKNIILFDRDGTNFPQGANALAFSRTFTVTDNLGYRAVDSDLVYNSRDWRFEINPAGNAFDIQAIATHELGHHLGLDHAGGGRDINDASTGCGPVVPAATMYYAVGFRNTSTRSLALDDIAGITAIYPKWTIAGAVFDNRTGQPFLNATIELQGTQSPLDTILVSSINTGQTGFFTLPLLDSIATVSFCQFGYQSNSTTVQFATPEIKQVLLGMEPLPLGELTGRIFDQNNAAGIEAEIILYAEGKELRRVASAIDGRYSMPSLPASNLPCSGYDRIEVRPLLNYAPVMVDSIQVNAGAPTELNFQLVPAEIAIIDDDGGQNSEAGLAAALSRLKLTSFEWSVAQRGSPAPIIDKLQSRYLLWTTGGATASTLGASETQQLTEFFNRGNHLFLAGARLAAQIESTDFFRNVLHARRIGTTTARIVKGLAGDPIGDGLLIGLLDANEKDVIATDGNPGAVVALQHTNSANDDLGGAGIRFAGAYKAVYFSFDFASILDGNPNLSSSDKILGHVLEWFGLRTGVEARQSPALSEVPQQFQLFSNYPNPFLQTQGSQQTTIKYAVAGPTRKNATASHVLLAVYDLLGRRLATLVDAPQVPGNYAATWNGRTDTGYFVGAGVYFYSLRVGGETRLTKKMIVLE